MPYESNLWTWLREGTRTMAARGELDVCRIETSTTVGYPDVEACLRGHNFHIELKGELRPKRSSTPIRIKISKEQILWLENRWRVGGACSVLVRVGARSQIRRYLIAGCASRRLQSPIRESTLKETSLVFPDCSAPRIMEVASRARRKT